MKALASTFAVLSFTLIACSAMNDDEPSDADVRDLNDRELTARFCTNVRDGRCPAEAELHDRCGLGFGGLSRRFLVCMARAKSCEDYDQCKQQEPGLRI